MLFGSKNGSQRSSYQRMPSPANSASSTELKRAPYDQANLFTRYWFWFMVPLFRKGWSGELVADDIGPPPRVDQSKILGTRLQHNYNRQLIDSAQPSFLGAICKTFGWQLFFYGLCDTVAKCFAYPMQTVALGWLIRDSGIYLQLGQQLQQQQQAAAAAAAAADLTAATSELDAAYWRIVYDACYLMLFTMIAIVLGHPYFFMANRIGMKCRIAACYMIYKKSLRLSQSALNQTTVGQMVNLLSNDVNRFDTTAVLVPTLMNAPLQAIVALGLLCVFYLGLYATLAGLATMLVFVLLQTSMGRGFSRFRSRTAKSTDERVRLMNEIILAMRIIKMYAWEEPFKLLVHIARKREVSTIGLASVLKCINQTLFFVSSKIIVFVSLITYVLLGYSFTPEIVFVSIGLANFLRISLTLFFPSAIANCAETIVSCKRIDTFLQLPEIMSSPATYKAYSDAYGCRYAIQMSKVYAAWAATQQDVVASSDARWAILRNLSLAVKPRDLVLVVGRVGSGKSSALMSMLGELPIVSGRLEINGRIAYASQDPWIFSGTVRSNILFGKPYERHRYREVVRVCSLERDLSLLVDGDATIVGERGVSLSGGQKARVNLARALYQDADVYLLDDPLSAVDAPVAKHIFNESLRSFLRKRTVVLATHQLQFLRFATKVLLMDRHKPAVFGTLQEVMESPAFADVGYSKEAFEDATTTAEDTAAGQSDEGTGGSNSPARAQKRVRKPEGGRTSAATGTATSDESDARLIRADSQASTNLSESVRVIAPLGDDKRKGKRSAGSHSSAEHSDTANKPTGSDQRKGVEALSKVSADASTYAYYLRNACSWIVLIWFVLINVGAQGVYQSTDYYLSLWTDSVQRHDTQGAAFVPTNFVDNLSLGETCAVYAGFVACCFLGAFLRTATFFVCSLRASVKIHDKLFESIIHAPMTFFDFSPIGMLLNRITRDIGFVDETLPAASIEIITIFVNISGILVLSILLNYKNVALCAALLIVSFSLRAFSGRSITRLKQIEGVTRSPVFSHLSNTLTGLATIRAFRVQDEFVNMFDAHQDSHTSAWFAYLCSGRWLATSMDWLCMSFITGVVAMLVAFELDATNASLVGLLISQAVVIPGPFQWGMRQLIETESQMTSVQRIKEFSCLQSETDLMPVQSAQTKLSTWSPAGSAASTSSGGSTGDTSAVGVCDGSSGSVAFVDVSLSYLVDEPPVLHSLTFSVRPHEKVGIVGRTGAGKSSLVAVLFRLYEFGGRIEIDGVDTKSMPLNELRRCMSIIPQDPILFAATIRKNLDPFNEYTDAQLWQALDAVQLKRVFAQHANGLDYLIGERGANFSVGQRQLICLARAIVRRNKILILDEATANVDPETDAFIQRTIASEFSECTVLTIAHRLITIVDSDRVLVLDAGQVREFDAPERLLANEQGLFTQMVNSSAQQAPRLRKLIEDAAKARAS